MSNTVSPVYRLVRSDPVYLSVLEDPGEKQVERKEVTVQLVLKRVYKKELGAKCVAMTTDSPLAPSLRWIPSARRDLEHPEGEKKMFLVVQTSLVGID